MDKVTMPSWLTMPPNRKVIKIGLLLTLLFQLSVLCVEYLGAVLPIWTGKEIILKTEPVDPRSLFRGNFVRLNFDINLISRIDAAEFKRGSVVYLVLEEKDGLWQAGEVSSVMPIQGDFIRGRVRNNYGEMLDIDYGIEAFFMPKEKALVVEKEMRGTGTAKVRVFISDTGKARAVGFKCIAKACE